jgi:hypothetical protein
MYSKGISWIDDCRIPFVDEGDKNKTLNAVWNIDEESKQSDMGFGTKKIGNVSKETGRFPANLLVCDDMLNDGVISKTNTKGQIRSEKRNWNYTSVDDYTKMSVINDKGTNSRYYDIDKWFDKIIE